MRAEDPHRVITSEFDLADERDAGRCTVEPDDATQAADARPPADKEIEVVHEHGAEADRTDKREVEVPAIETQVVEIREAVEDEPVRTEDDAPRTPTADETADEVERAQRALAELRARRDVEERLAAEEARADELSRRQAVDAEAQREADAPEADRAPVLERDSVDA